MDIEGILKRMRLSMPVQMTLTDVITGQPITISHDNLHQLLIADLNNVELESQLISNLYAEMSRFQAAAEYAATRGEAEYRAWRSKVQTEFREAREKAGEKKPTVKMVEDHYRNHPEYDLMTNAGKRYEAVAKFFGNLAKAFYMKSRVLSDHTRAQTGYDLTEKNASDAEERLGAYSSLRAEADKILQETNVAAAEAWLGGSSTKKKKAPKKPIEGDSK